MADFEINWYEEAVVLKIKDASNEMLERVAFKVEDIAKVNVTENQQVDTGFMRASIYTHAPDKSSYSKAKAEAIARDPLKGKQMNAERIPRTGAIVAAGANYSIYQEIRRSFLYKALQEVAGQVADAEIEKVKL